jgi:N-acetyl-anhydromuramyl-L-alanine amidase AmpD
MKTNRAVHTIVVHSSATRPAVLAGAKQIRAWHKAQGWSDIGYHFVVRRTGAREVGRSLSRIGSHVRGHNEGTIGICLEGGLSATTGKPEDNYTPLQKAELFKVIQELRAANPSIKQVCGHRDLSPDLDRDGKVEPHEWVKACPCFDVAAWYQAAQTQARAA